MLLGEEFFTLKVMVDDALSAFNKREFDKSHKLCMDFLGRIPDDFLKYISDAFHIAGLIELSKGFLEQGRNKLEKASILYPLNSQIHAHLGYYYAEMDGDILKAEEKLKKAKELNPNDPSVERLENFLVRLKKDKIPGVMVNSMPKSATMSIWGSLHSGLGIPRVFISNNVRSYKYEIVDPEKAKRFVKGGCAAQGHLAATNLNLFLMERAGIDRMVIHVRDPRQAMLSWVHFIDKLYKADSLLVMDYPLCDDYFSLTHEEQIHCEQYFLKKLEEKISVHIEHYMPMLIEWLIGWMEQEEHPKCNIKIKFTRFEDFKYEPEKFYRDILSFYNIDMARFKMPDFNLHGKSHFRKGLVEEFRDVFTSEQMGKVNDMIPDRIFNKFGWRK